MSDIWDMETSSESGGDSGNSESNIDDKNNENNENNQEENNQKNTKEGEGENNKDGEGTKDGEEGKESKEGAENNSNEEGQGKESEGESEEVQSFKNEISTLEGELQEKVDQIEAIQVEFSAVQGLIENGTKEGGDPLAPLFHLVEISGGNVNNYVDSVNNFIKSEVANVMEAMEKYGDNGADMYLKELSLKQKQGMHELSSKIKQQREDGHKENQNFRATLKDQNVTMRQFNAAHKELVEFGHENLSKAQVVEYAQMMPHFERSENIIQEHIDTDDLTKEQINEVATNMAKLSKQRPDLDDMDIIEMAAKISGLKQADSSEGGETQSNKNATETDGENKNVKPGDNQTPDNTQVFSDDEESIWTVNLH